jgi:hypothetical protein
MQIRNNVFAGWCPIGNAEKDMRGELALTVAPSEIEPDYTLRTKYDGAAGPAQGEPTYQHETADGGPRKLLTVGAKD